MNYLPVKSAGRTVMTSDFVTVFDGFVRYSDEVWEKIKNREDVQLEIKKKGDERSRRAGCILDVSADGYYNGPKCVADFEKVSLPSSSQVPALLNSYELVLFLVAVQLYKYSCLSYNHILHLNSTYNRVRKQATPVTHPLCHNQLFLIYRYCIFLRQCAASIYHNVCPSVSQCGLEKVNAT